MTDENGGNRSQPPCAEVAARASRRTFTREYKRRIVREAGEARGTGGVGALLRREGLYSSTLATWRREFEGGAGAPPEEKRRGPKPRVTAEHRAVRRLERENARLRKRLEITEALLDLQKKTLVMLESLELKDGSE